MKALVVCASKYGSTREIGGWIAERLGYEGIAAELRSAGDDGPLDDYGLVIMGSGIYNHGVLPGLKVFLELKKDALKGKKVVFFGVAMKTEPVFYKGRVRGGLEHLLPQLDLLGDAVLHAGMLHGEMVPQKLEEKERTGLMGFYRALGLSETEMKERMLPRTLMSKKEAWEFAETVIQRLNASHNGGGDGTIKQG